MSEVDIVEKMKQRILPRIPQDVRPQIEWEIGLIEKEVHLRADVFDCMTCPLAQNCTNKVPGVGNLASPIMLVGESPGEHEDQEGIPFVGPSGQLLNKALEAAGFRREDLYLTNILKCYPEGNRNPSPEEIQACLPHLRKEVEVIRPKVIVAIGSIAANTLIHSDFKITQEHGHWFELNGGIRAMAIYHPSYLLRLGEGTQRQIRAKWDVFHALKKLKEFQESGFTDMYQQPKRQAPLPKHPNPWQDLSEDVNAALYGDTAEIEWNPLLK